MAFADGIHARLASRTTLAWLLGILLTIAYVALPDAEERSLSAASEAGEDADDDPARLTILSISPHDPYPGSTVAIAHSHARHELAVYAGKTPLRVLARRPGEMVAELPRNVLPGDLKIRVASAEAVPMSEREVRSKAFHLRVRAPNWQKAFRSLMGGAALIVLGIGFLAGGVRKSTGLDAARLLTRVTRHHGLVLGFGGGLGAVTQSTTGAAGMLAGLASSGVLPVVPAAIAFLGAPLGAAAVPLLATGLVAPREGLIAISVGVLWLRLAADRRSQALARLVLGAGLVAFGLQVLRPGLEPFLSDAMLWSVADRLRADSPRELVVCALLGMVVVAGLHGPAPLIVLMLGVAHATGHGDLRTGLAVLSGTGLGAALAALIIAPLGVPARALARLNLCLGALSTLLSLASIDLWTSLSELLLGPQVSPLHWTHRMAMSELGLHLAVAFALSQLAVALVLLPVAPRLARWLERHPGEPKAALALPQAVAVELRAALDQVLLGQHGALGSVVALALTGVRKRGHEAEETLADARHVIERLLAGPVRHLPGSEQAAALGGAAYVALQLQNALDFLLRQTERMIDVRISGTESALGSSVLPWDDETRLRSLHRLVSEGLEAARRSLVHHEPLDLDSARTREININRIEAEARSHLLDAERAPGLLESHLHVLQVVDAYEVSGNQIYRLAEILGQSNLVASPA